MRFARTFAVAAAMLVGAAPAGAGPHEAVDAIVQTAMKAKQAPGVAIAVVSKGTVVAAKGFGLANVEHNAKVRQNTVFQSASVGKQFTAAAVMLMVEDGKLGLDDSIAAHFDDAPKSWAPITVRHLLTHTSGIPDYTDDDFDYRRAHGEDDLVKMAYGLKLLFAPGARWSYSNTGYVLLGILVHKVSGEFYGDVLKARVFAPLGMKTARVISEADIVPHRAAGYRTVGGALKNQEWVAPELNTTADGALYLTVLDLIAWDRAVRTKALLKAESWAQIFAPVKLNSGKTYPYGFGWFVDEFAGAPKHSHTGSWQGFRSAIARYPRNDLTVIVLANHAGLNAGKLADVIAGQFDPILIEPAPKPITDREPTVTEKLRDLIGHAAEGTLTAKSFTWISDGDLPTERYAKLLKPLGALKRLDLLKRREMGDDRVYLYDAVYADKTLRVRFAVAPDSRISTFAITEKDD